MQWTELVIFALLFGIIAGLGFYAIRWKALAPLDHIDEWGLGGRRFGSKVTWFLVGGDIFTAYTFVSVPALLFGGGAAGFFALPYVVIVYPLVFLPLLRLWSVSRRRRYVTPADFVLGRYGSTTLALLVALTGIAATVFYIALQLAGLEAVLQTMGLNWHGPGRHIPLFVAFAIVAAYTYRSGLRAPALIAYVKAFLIISVIAVAAILLPMKLGGVGSIFDAADAALQCKNAVNVPLQDCKRAENGILLDPSNVLQYMTLALGSALALFLYPHTLTPVFAARSRNVLKLNMILLPIWSAVLALFALLGYAALATERKLVETNEVNTVVPRLFDQAFPNWFTGIAFAAIGIGALVPASVMSIAAANLWTRNIYKAYLNRDATAEQETSQSKIASLAVKLGAVVLIVGLEPGYSINLQLIGGVIILQTLPMVAIPLYTRWFHFRGLIAGWAVGLVGGVLMMYSLRDPITGLAHFGDTAFPLSSLSVAGWAPCSGSQAQIYAGFLALLGNLVVAALVTIVLNLREVPTGSDETQDDDYHADGDSLHEGNVLDLRRATL